MGTYVPVQAKTSTTSERSLSLLFSLQFFLFGANKSYHIKLPDDFGFSNMKHFAAS